MNYASCRRSAPVAHAPPVIVLFAFKTVGKGEGRERWTRRKRDKEREEERYIRKLAFLATILLLSATLSSRHRNFQWHSFVAALARLLLKPAALLCNSDVSGGSSKVRFQRRLKDGLKMSEKPDLATALTTLFSRFLCHVRLLTLTY